MVSESTNWENDESVDPHSVCGLLKLFLRELPEPIVSPEICRPSIKEEGSFEQLVKAQDILNNLSSVRYSVLKMLIGHLIKVISKSYTNKMSIKNVSIVFSATLRIPSWLLVIFITDFDSLFAD